MIRAILKGMYPVALLIERQLEPVDADQIIALHEELDDTVRFSVLMPIESSAALLTSSLSTLGGGEIMPLNTNEDLADISAEIRRLGQAELDASLGLLRDRGAHADGTLTEDDPVDALVRLVTEVGAREAIVLTESHVIREFFHVDWTSRARRRLDVPILHLLEHLPPEAQR